MTTPTIWSVSPVSATTPSMLRELIGQFKSSDDPRALWTLTNCLRHGINWWKWVGVSDKVELVQLEWSDDLANAAKFHAVEMAELNYLANESPHGDTPADRAAAVGYRHDVMELVGAGSTKAWDIFAAWARKAQATRPHYLTGLFDPRLKVMGVGQQDGYWVAMFGMEA
jgi:Cysteine-rich secretory protein family